MIQNKNIRHFLPHLLIVLITLFGFYLRYNDITHEASYWNDESHAATYARAIVQTGKPVDATGYNTGLYQIGLYMVTAVSFWLFGITEYAGRLPSVLIGTLLIPLIFYVGRKMIGTGATLIAAGLLTVSQMQLAWSTQLRPYIWMEAFAIITVFLCYQSLKDKQPILNRYLLWGCIVTGVSFLFHGTGLFNGLFVASVFLYRIIREKKYTYLWILVPAALLTVGALSLTPFLGAIFNLNTSVAHYSVFLRHHYGWLLVGAALGTVMLWKTNRSLCVLLSTGAIGIIALALFKVNDRYVRYSITAFPLLYLLLGAGVIGLVDHLVKSPAKRFTGYILFLGVLLISPIAKGKLVFSPQIYYSINADMRENPIVDYKTAFQKIAKLTHGDKRVFVMDAIFDRVLWYMPDQAYGFLFTIPTSTPQATTVEAFEKIKSAHPMGIAIVENWPSLTPNNLQEHLRKTLKHEFEVGTVPGNEKDPWNINVYSWGL